MNSPYDKEQYKIAFNGYQEENRRFWTMFNMLVLINTGLLIFGANAKSENLFRLVLPLFGMILSILWWLAQLRYAAWVRWWDAKMQAMEEEDSSSFSQNQTKNSNRFIFKHKTLDTILEQTSPFGCFSLKDAVKSDTISLKIGLKTSFVACVIPAIIAVLWALLFILTMMDLVIGSQRETAQADTTRPITNYIVITNTLVLPKLPVVVVTNNLTITNLRFSGYAVDSCDF
ncbi:MAG: hypothetical protein AB9869_25490 [Verrucomicrobiia bacterium]